MSFIQEEKDWEFLKSEELGVVISQGLAQLFIESPRFPVDYLSKWLLNYSQTKKNEKILAQRLKEKEDLVKKYKADQEEKEKQLKLQKEKEEAEQKIENQFKETIKNEEYLNEMIKLQFPDFLELRKKFTGVYVGQLGFQIKQITDEDEGDDQAHFNINDPKVINFIGASKSHQQIIIGKVLELEKGVIGEVFKVQAEEENQQELEEGAQIVDKKNYIYYPDVIKEQRIHYFRLPRLGAFLAIPLFYNSCLSEASFDAGVDERQKFLKLYEEQQKEREVKDQEFALKVKELQDAGEDTTEMDHQYQIEKEQQEEVKEPEFKFEKKEFVICADTLGQEREISENDRQYVEDYVKLYAKCWEEKEKDALSKDIDHQLKYISDITQQEPQQYSDQEDKAAEERQSTIEDIKDKTDKRYIFETESAKLEKIKEFLSDPNLQQQFLDLKENRVLKFPQILQNILYLLGYKREEINIPGTHQLNWKGVKPLINQKFFEDLVKYSHRGQKTNKVQLYANVNKISQKIEKFEKDAVNNYNICYGRMLKWLKLTCHLRKQDIEIRRNEVQQKKIDRENKNAELAKQALDKEKALQEKKDSLQPEELEIFLEKEIEEWNSKWDEMQPIIEIPEDVGEQVDLDCEFE